jgi:hypothetical protein
MTVRTARDLVGASRRELAALAAHGTPFDPAVLAGRRYDGISLGLPRWLERLTWTKFAKAFARDHATGALRGWNIRIADDGLDRPWTPKQRRDGRAITFGDFTVHRGADGAVALRYPAGVLVDPLVALAGPDLLLGSTQLAVGGRRIQTPSWFVLSRGPAL